VWVVNGPKMCILKGKTYQINGKGLTEKGFWTLDMFEKVLYGNFQDGLIGGA